MKNENVFFNNIECKINKVWEGGYYDLETVEKTEKGIIEVYLSVPQEQIKI
jgi:hypothetical protein